MIIIDLICLCVMFLIFWFETDVFISYTSILKSFPYFYKLIPKVIDDYIFIVDNGGEIKLYNYFYALIFHHLCE